MTATVTRKYFRLSVGSRKIELVLLFIGLLLTSRLQARWNSDL